MMSYMARKRRGRGRKNPTKRIRKQTNFLMPGKAQTLEQFLIASMIQGMFTAAGAVMGTILAKYVLKEADNIIPLPESIKTIISKEAG